MSCYNVSSLYLHFPYCRHICNYCDFYKSLKNTDDRDFSVYHESLASMWDEQQLLLDDLDVRVSEIETIFVGGGTPSLWGEEGADFLKSFFESRDLIFSDELEFTLEANPGFFFEQVLNRYSNIGVNRWSLGVQTLNPKLLQAIDRVHSIEDSFKALKVLKKSKQNYSVDFMLGLPCSVDYKRDVVSELKQVLEFEPKHISVYILTVGKAYPMRAGLPQEDYIRKEFLTVSDYLRSVGFEHYEVSNFAREEKYSKHNMKYWKGESVLGLGASATGFLSRTARGATRYKWSPSSKLILESLTDEQVQLEQLFLSLRLNQAFHLEELCPEIDHSNILKLKENWVSSGYGYETPQGFRLLPAGLLMADSLIDDLFKLNKAH